ncbi:hypothetical protein Pmar_PMAR021428 [Perkinsus marinus ATCC 50983]|uniref:Uncharacterized protein n=1 Tax=Perkinsus marinus (strain ATCC 50983 / TXsc) TaxID=423536 RepID=C5KX93_PERM5|nr:hypothetical protein Pmar_PMAR021428 [Perkinsus marinus ATCC 50983]EER10949.1 hypothetical protein Pmar_PMAR021428 [Perkinsus marinus ATCC 50983]|eukprot:XP_002779154.1 hypothetical protein Pmar_PMAR021428 [Perkinsus marinus ATCC 50983]
MVASKPLLPMVCACFECSKIFEVVDIGKKERFRPEESIFNIRCWADGVDPPEGAKKAARNRRSMTKMMMKMMWLKLTGREKSLGPRERRPIMFAK